MNLISEQAIQTNRYPAYKDSGIDWLGEIPAHWEVVKGKWLFDKQDRPVRKEDGVVTAFRDGQVTLRSNRREEGFTNAIQEHGYQGIRRGDLVIHAMDAFAGAIGVSDSDGKSSPVYAACTPRKGAAANPYFFAYFLRHLAKTGFIESLAKGIRERSTDFRFRDFGLLQLALPPLSEQTRIAEFLDRKTAQIDKAIAQKERLIDLLNERRQVLIHRAVTRGLNPNAPMKDSGTEWIGKIPAHWEVKRAKYLFGKIEQGWSPQCDSYVADKDQWGVLKVGCVNGAKFNPLENKVLPDNLKPRLEYKIFVGDILISRANTTELVGSAAIVTEISHKLLLCDKLYRIKNNEQTILSAYFINYMVTPCARAQIEIGASGASPSMQNIGQGIITNMWIIVPSIFEQTNIVSYLHKKSLEFDTVIKQQRQQIQKLQELKATLINSAVTGKIKV